MEKAAARRRRELWAEQERLVAGVNWGFVLSQDHKGRARRKWESIRRRMSGSQTKGLSGAALDRAVMAIAASDPSLVAIQQRGA